MESHAIGLRQGWDMCPDDSDDDDEDDNEDQGGDSRDASMVTNCTAYELVDHCV